MCVLSSDWLEHYLDMVEVDGSSPLERIGLATEHAK